MKLVNAKKIRDYVKREINPYGRPFEGTVYEFGLKLMKYLENASVDYDVGMTDEELAVSIMCPAEYDLSFNKECKCNGEMNRNCCKCTLKWLQSEAE